jgi:hypothetical protein
MLVLAAACSALAQDPSPQPSTAPVSKPVTNTPSNSAAKPPEVRPISEEELRHRLQGKTFYLRGGFSDNDLRFDENGRLASSSGKVSYALSMVQIDRVNLSKHKLELVGIRYGIHFLGAGPTEDPLAASDKVRITPKKKGPRQPASGKGDRWRLCAGARRTLDRLSSRLLASLLP